MSNINVESTSTSNGHISPPRLSTRITKPIRITKRASTPPDDGSKYTPITAYPNYEVSCDDTNPYNRYTIRHTKTHHIIPIWYTEDGYAVVTLDETKVEFLHIIVTETLRNKGRATSRRTYDYVDTLPDTCVKLVEYNGVMISDRYWYDPTTETVYLKTARGGKYKVVNPFNNGSNRGISIQNADGVHKQFGYRSFIREMRSRYPAKDGLDGETDVGDM